MASNVDLALNLATVYVSSFQERSWRKVYQVNGIRCELTIGSMSSEILKHLKTDVKSEQILSEMKQPVEQMCDQLVNMLMENDTSNLTSSIYQIDGLPFFQYQLEIKAKLGKRQVDNEVPILPDYKDIWHEVWCQGCKTQIRGSRYKCISCPNFDLCSECEEKNAENFSLHYWDHVFIRMRLPGIPVPQLTPPPTPLAISDFHQISVFICPNCRYMEFPGCAAHMVIFTEPKGDRNARCCKCEIATDNWEGWSICRKCKASPYNLNWFLLSNREGTKLFQAFNKTGIEGRFISHLLLHCTSCQIIEFPSTYGGGLCVNNDGQLWDPSRDAFFRVEHWRCRHFGSCNVPQSQIITVPVVFHVKEARFLSKAIANTPPLFYVTKEMPKTKANAQKEVKPEEAVNIETSSKFEIKPSTFKGEAAAASPSTTEAGSPVVPSAPAPAPPEAAARDREDIDELAALMDDIDMEISLRSNSGPPASSKGKTAAPAKPAPGAVAVLPVAPSPAAAPAPSPSPSTKNIPEGYEDCHQIIMGFLSEYRFFFEDFAEPENNAPRKFVSWVDFIHNSADNIEGLLYEDPDLLNEIMSDVTTPIITFAFFEPPESYNMVPPSKKKEFLYDLLQTLPQENKEILLLLIRLIRTLTAPERKNLLTAPSLVSLFIKYIMQPNDLNYKKAVRKKINMNLQF